ncbi:MAG: ArsR/SmtB family transcription factor [Acidimicrobiales bacterium]
MRPREIVGSMTILDSDDRLRQQLEELVANICKALNDPKRLMLLYALRDRPRTVSELGQLLGTPQSNTSQHLAVLRERALVSTERQGNSVLYSLRYPKVLDAVDMLRSIMSEEAQRRQDLHLAEEG